MNALFFYAAAGLMLGGGLILQTVAGRRWRIAAYAALAAGIGVLAAGLGAWGIVALALIFIVVLFLPPLLRRVPFLRSVKYGRQEGTEPIRYAEEEKVESEGSPPRKGIAALLAAALAGILLSVIWTNPLWKIKTPAEQDFAAPGIGLVLLLFLLALILVFSFRGKEGRGVRQSDRTETFPEP